MPYANHNDTPSVKSAYMPREMSAVWRERMIFHTWGMKENVVRVAAAVPTQFAIFMAGFDSGFDWCFCHLFIQYNRRKCI